MLLGHGGMAGLNIERGGLSKRCYWDLNKEGWSHYRVVSL